MSTRRNFLKQAATVGVLTAASVQISKSAESTGPDKTRQIARTPGPRIRSVIRREETVIRHGGIGDNWHMSWASDDRQYLSLCDGSGFSSQPSASYNSRMFAISGGPRVAKFHDLPGYPMLGKPTQKPTDPRYYSFGTLALNGYLYQFMSTFNRTARLDEMEKPDLSDLVRFNGAKLIYSPDGGRTWHNQDGSTPVVWESWDRRSRDTMVFFREDQDAFSLLSILQMGKNYGYNQDGYIYVYSPNGNSEGTMNELVMFRVPTDGLLDRQKYEYFAGRAPSGGAKWTGDIEGRAVVHTFPSGWVNTLFHPYAWHPSVIYNAPLGMYMMANWGMGCATDGSWFGKPSYLGIWIARNPWGPWVQIHEETRWLPAADANALAYQPQFAPKWLAPDGKSFWLAWTDFQGHDNVEAIKRFQEERNRQSTNRNGEHDHAAAARLASIMRAHMPYYAFNVQRLDLVLA